MRCKNKMCMSAALKPWYRITSCSAWGIGQACIQACCIEVAADTIQLYDTENALTQKLQYQVFQYSLECIGHTKDGTLPSYLPGIKSLAWISDCCSSLAACWLLRVHYRVGKAIHGDSTSSRRPLLLHQCLRHTYLAQFYVICNWHSVDAWRLGGLLWQHQLTRRSWYVRLAKLDNTVMFYLLCSQRVDFFSRCNGTRNGCFTGIFISSIGYGVLPVEVKLEGGRHATDSLQHYLSTGLVACHVTDMSGECMSKRDAQTRCNRG